MNELDPDKKNLKRGAHNFEKQKNESNLIEGGKKKVFFASQKGFFCYTI